MCIRYRRANGQTPQVQVYLSQFEQVFTPDGSASEGRVLLQAVLLNGRAVVGQLRIATRAPAPTQDAAGGVAALRQALSLIHIFVVNCRDNSTAPPGIERNNT